MFRYVTIQDVFIPKMSMMQYPLRNHKPEESWLSHVAFIFVTSSYMPHPYFPDSESEAEGLLLAFYSFSLSEWGIGNYIQPSSWTGISNGCSQVLG